MYWLINSAVLDMVIPAVNEGPQSCASFKAVALLEQQKIFCILSSPFLSQGTTQLYTGKLGRKVEAAPSLCSWVLNVTKEQAFQPCSEVTFSTQRASLWIGPTSTVTSCYMCPYNSVFCLYSGWCFSPATTYYDWFLGEWTMFNHRGIQENVGIWKQISSPGPCPRDLKIKRCRWGNTPGAKRRMGELQTSGGRLGNGQDAQRTQKGSPELEHSMLLLTLQSI